MHENGTRMKGFIRFWRDESGATAIEYGLIVVLIVIGIVASLQSIGTNYVAGPLSNVATHLAR